LISRFMLANAQGKRGLSSKSRLTRACKIDSGSLQVLNTHILSISGADPIQYIFIVTNLN